MSFDQLGLRIELRRVIMTRGYTVPTPVQAQAIPVILDGRDILACAQTGTGKTDAFALPLVEILSREKGGRRDPRALVLTPTRELAVQVGACIKAYARRVSLRCTVVYGGVHIHPQINRLRRGIDILVATPGRLLDLAEQGNLDLSRIGFLVFDEADRMLDLGFSQEISRILDLVPTERRTMLFSATYTPSIRNLAGRMLKAPKHIEVTPRNTAAESVVQKIYRVDRSNKRGLLLHLINQEKRPRILVFTRTRHGADKLAEKLTAQGIPAAVLHSSKRQSFRTRTLAAFKSGEIRILVATDVAARGLDISDLPYVVNYDMPHIAENYVHRIGRTGRAGEPGIAVSLVSRDEAPHLQAIEKLLKRKIPEEQVDGYTEESDVPDFVLYRPGIASSEKKADREIKEIIAGRAAKQRSKPRKAKTGDSGKNPGRESKFRSGRKNGTADKKTPGPGLRSQPSSRRRKTRGMRQERTHPLTK